MFLLTLFRKLPVLEKRDIPRKIKKKSTLAKEADSVEMPLTSPKAKRAARAA
jgi:hypothetical protein